MYGCSRTPNFIFFLNMQQYIKKVHSAKSNLNLTHSEQDFIPYHFGNFWFRTFDLHTGNIRVHADLRSRDCPFQLKADFIGFGTLKNFQSIFIFHILKVDLGTQQLVTFIQKTIINECKSGLCIDRTDCNS